MGQSVNQYQYLLEIMRTGDRSDPQFAKHQTLYKKIRQFCKACNNPDEVCEAAECNFYSLKPKKGHREELDSPQA